MKRTLIPLCLLLVGGISFFYLQKDTGIELRQPTEIRVSESEEDGENQNKREEWFEAMHRAAPGTNWRALEYKTKMSRHKSRSESRNYALSRNSGLSDTIADGLLIGTWYERGSSNQAGSVFDVEYDAETDKFWLISAGGTLFKGNRDGSGWEVVNQDLQFSTGTLKFIPTETGRRLIANIGQVPHYSDDEGLTWNSSTGINISDGWGRTKETVFMDNGEKIYTLSKSDYWDDWRIFYSEDKGESFTQTGLYTGSDQGESQVALCRPHNSDSLYYARFAGTNIQIWKIDTETNSSELLNSSGGFDPNDRTILVASETEESMVFYTYDGEKYVFKSEDLGETWETRDTLPVVPWDVGMYLSPSDPDVLFIGAVDAYRSLDGGHNWEIVNYWHEYYGDIEGKLHADMMDFVEYETSDGESFTLVSNHGGLSISYDHCVTTQNIGLEDLNVSQYYSVRSSPANPNLIIGGTQDQGLQRTVDNGSNEVLPFTQVISGDYGHTVFTNEGNSFWTAYPGGIVDYYANALTGGPVGAMNMDSDNETVWISPLHSSLQLGENAVYMAGGNINGGPGSYLVKLTNQGNITASQGDYNFKAFTGGELSAIEVSEINPDYLYTATTNGRFFYSQDKGETWEQNVGFLAEGHYLYGQSIFASRKDINTVYLAGSGYSNPAVYKSTDGGEFFSDLSEGLPPTLVFDLTANTEETLLFAATEAGPYVYIMAEERWYDLSGLCAPAQTYWSVEYLEDSKTVRFGTYGRGIWDFNVELQPLPSSTNDFTNKLEVKVYPNPAVELITIESEFTEGNLSLIDAQGKLVLSSEIISEQMQVPVADLARGVYILNLQSGKKQASTRIILSE